MAKLCRTGRVFSIRYVSVVAATLFMLITVYTTDFNTLLREQLTYCLDHPEGHVDPCESGVRETVIHVMVVGDEHLYDGMLTLAASIVVNTRADVMFHFVTPVQQTCKLTEAIESTALRTIPYEVIPFSEDKLKGQYKVKSPRKDLDNPLNFARFYVSELLPNACRAIYIDADCLVLGDIGELHNLTLKDNHVMAVLNESVYSAKRRLAGLAVDFKNPYVKARGIPPLTDMINNGVFVADLHRWRQQNISSKLLYWMRLNVNSSVIKWGDSGSGSQALTLLAVFDKYTPLPKEWNTLSGYHGKKLGRKKLLHWNGAKKPWKTNHTTFVTLWKNYYWLLKKSTHLPRLPNSALQGV